MTTLRLTNPALAALADGTARGTRAIEMRSIVIGSGRGTPGSSNDDRTTLRAQQASAAVTGSIAVSGRIALQASFETAAGAGFDVTEVGVMARIGSGGAPFLFAYQVVDIGDARISVAEPGVTLLIACVLNVVRSAAEINVTVSPTLSLSVGQTRAEIDTLIGAATTALRGLVELATPAEARTGTDGSRAVTPAALAAALAAHPQLSAAQIQTLLDGRLGAGWRRDTDTGITAVNIASATVSRDLGQNGPDSKYELSRAINGRTLTLTLTRVNNSYHSRSG